MGPRDVIEKTPTNFLFSEHKADLFIVSFFAPDRGWIWSQSLLAFCTHSSEARTDDGDPGPQSHRQLKTQMAFSSGSTSGVDQRPAPSAPVAITGLLTTPPGSNTGVSEIEAPEPGERWRLPHWGQSHPCLLGVEPDVGAAESTPRLFSPPISPERPSGLQAPEQKDRAGSQPPITAKADVTPLASPMRVCGRSEMHVRTARPRRTS